MTPFCALPADGANSPGDGAQLAAARPTAVLSARGRADPPRARPLRVRAAVRAVRRQVGVSQEPQPRRR